MSDAFFQDVDSCVRSARRRETGASPYQGLGSDWTLRLRDPAAPVSHHLSTALISLFVRRPSPHAALLILFVLNTLPLNFFIFKLGRVGFVLLFLNFFLFFIVIVDGFYSSKSTAP